jgi:hypothetical protein
MQTGKVAQAPSGLRLEGASSRPPLQDDPATPRMPVAAAGLKLNKFGVSERGEVGVSS